jgi:hypothetical protein
LFADLPDRASALPLPAFTWTGARDGENQDVSQFIDVPSSVAEITGCTRMFSACLPLTALISWSRELAVALNPELRQPVTEAAKLLTQRGQTNNVKDEHASEM